VLAASLPSAAFIARASTAAIEPSFEIDLFAAASRLPASGLLAGIFPAALPSVSTAFDSHGRP